MPHPPLALPEVGQGRESQIAATLSAFSLVGEDIARRNPDTVIILSPHGAFFRDAVSVVDTPVLSGDMARFGAPQVRLSFPINRELAEAVILSAEDIPVNGHSPFLRLDEQAAQRYGVELTIDHGAFVPLYYAFPSAVNRGDTLKGLPSLVHITCGMLPLSRLYELGKRIRRAADRFGGRTICIASGDLSHRLSRSGPYSYSPAGAAFDALIVDILKRGAFAEISGIDEALAEEAGECGLRGFAMLAGMTGGASPEKPEVFSYEGPFGVGYCVAAGVF
jgi:aromatic ring-opening dioxygenase LigB subunit